jgi:hypothetical protein
MDQAQEDLNAWRDAVTELAEMANTLSAEHSDATSANVIGVADSDSDDFLSTVVRYDPSDSSSVDAARTLSASLAGAARVERAGLGATLEVVVGDDWPGVSKVVVQKPPREGVRQESEDICNVPG